MTFGVAVRSPAVSHDVWNLGLFARVHSTTELEDLPIPITTPKPNAHAAVKSEWPGQDEARSTTPDALYY